MQIVCMGELLIDFVALESGVTVGEASGFEKKAGGAPANVAVAIKRLSMDSAFITQVGDDPFGHYLAGVIAEEAVNTDGITFSKEARTMLAFVSLREDGERSFNFYRHPSADMLMTPDTVAYNVIDNSDLFHFGSITLISEPAKSATLAAAEYAKENGKLISYDPNLRLALWDDEQAAHKGMRLGFDYAHIVKISDEEQDVVLRAGETVADLWEQYPQLQLVMLTRGSDGCVMHTRNGDQHEHAGYSVKSVDTTGAGDTFMAGAVVGILEQLGDSKDFSTLDYAPILDLANAGGALATVGRGAIPSLPTREEVENFIAEQA
ncbi:MAG: PfkB family carbohydrate kinase [Chloroflexota bacterium]